jgi:hypothetical protein
MLREHRPDAIRFEDGRPVAVGDQQLAEPTRAVRTGSGLWALFVAGEDVVVALLAGGAISGSPAEVRERLEHLIAGEGLDDEDREAASSFLPFLGEDDPGEASVGPRSRVSEGVPPTWWLSGTKNAPPDPPAPVDPPAPPAPPG